MKSKKSFLFSISLVIVTLITLIAVMLAINGLEAKNTAWKGIGGRAYGIIQAYGEEDILTFYLEQSAKYAAYNTVEVIAYEGGIHTSCGNLQDKQQYQEYTFWNNRTQWTLCPPNIYEEFIDYFDFDKTYIKAYSKNVGHLPENNYKYLVQDGRITGIAVKPAMINIYTQKQEIEIPAKWDVFRLWSYIITRDPFAVGTYAVKPSFSIDFDYNFSIYDKIADALKKVISECDSLSVNDVPKCIKDTVESADSKLAVKVTQKQDDIFLLDITQTNIVFPEFTKMSGTNPVIRIGIYVP